MQAEASDNDWEMGGELADAVQAPASPPSREQEEQTQLALLEEHARYLGAQEYRMDLIRELTGQGVPPTYSGVPLAFPQAVPVAPLPSYPVQLPELAATAQLLPVLGGAAATAADLLPLDGLAANGGVGSLLFGGILGQGLLLEGMLPGPDLGMLQAGTELTGQAWQWAPPADGMAGEAGVPLLQSFPAELGLGPARRVAPRKRRARILKDGQLTMIVYGQNEALLWAKRVATFQQAMRRVLGDRRRSFNWGGSIIDSVVGAFLTQNVSDFLSSKAFMELASRYPVKQQGRLPAVERQGPAAAEECSGLVHAAGKAGGRGGGAAEVGWHDREDTVDWEAVRTAPPDEVSDAIKCRGMQFFLARRIQAFLNSVRQHNKRRLAAQQVEQQVQAQERAVQQEQQPQQVQANGEGPPVEQGPGEGWQWKGLELAAALHGAGSATDPAPGPAMTEAGSGAEMLGGSSGGLPGSPASCAAAPSDSTTAPTLGWQGAPPGYPTYSVSVPDEAVAAAAVAGAASTVEAGSRVASDSGAEERPSSLHGPLGSGCPADSGMPSPKRRRAGPVELRYEKEVEEGAVGSKQASLVPAQELQDMHLETGRDASNQQASKAGSKEDAGGEGLLSLEWLRDVSDDEARDYLMSIEGLGRKSVACIMLLTLGRKEFPVDVNVGRIAARLGWVPLDSEQSVEDLDDYAPEPEVHKYLHSRLLAFDVETLYELHYQSITLGKVFCSKANPNCLACPMHDHCEYSLNNGPSLHGRKRQRRQEAGADLPFGQVPPPSLYTAQGLPEEAGAAAVGSGGQGVPMPPPLVRTRRKYKRRQQAEELAEEDELELELELGLSALASPRPAGGAGKRPGPKRQVHRHEFAQPAEVPPGAMPLDELLQTVCRRQRTGPNTAAAPPAPDPNPEPAAQDPSQLQPAAEERGRALRSRAGTDLPPSSPSISPAPPPSDGHRRELSPWGSKEPPAAASTVPEPDQAHEPLQPTVQPSHATRPPKGEAPSVHSMALRGVRPPSKAAANSPVKQLPTTAAQAVPAAEGKQGLALRTCVAKAEAAAKQQPGSTAEGRRATPGSGRGEAAALDSWAPVIGQEDAAAPGVGPRRSVRHSKAEQEPGPAAFASSKQSPVPAPAAPAADGPPPTKDGAANKGPGSGVHAPAGRTTVLPAIGTTRSGRAVRPPRAADDEPLLVLAFDEEAPAQHEGLDAAADPKPREASSKYLAWVLHHAPRKPRSPCVLRPPRPRAAEACPGEDAVQQQQHGREEEEGQGQDQVVEEPQRAGAGPLVVDMLKFGGEPNVASLCKQAGETAAEAGAGSQPPVLNSGTLPSPVALDSTGAPLDPPTLWGQPAEEDPGCAAPPLPQPPALETDRLPRGAAAAAVRPVAAWRVPGLAAVTGLGPSTQEPSDRPAAAVRMFRSAGLPAPAAPVLPHPPPAWAGTACAGAGKATTAATAAAAAAFRPADSACGTAIAGEPERGLAEAGDEQSLQAKAAAGSPGSVWPQQAATSLATPLGVAKDAAASAGGNSAGAAVGAEAGPVLEAGVAQLWAEAEAGPEPEGMPQAGAAAAAEEGESGGHVFPDATLPQPAGDVAFPPAEAEASVAEPSMGAAEAAQAGPLPGMQPGAAHAARSQAPLQSAAEECERLVSVGREMGAVQGALAVATGSQAPTLLLEQRLVELGLRALGVHTALHAGSATAVLSAARRQYHLLSMRTHPDKCAHPLAQQAFAVLSLAFNVASQAAAAVAASGARATQQPPAAGLQPSPGAVAEGEGSELPGSSREGAAAAAAAAAESMQPPCSSNPPEREGSPESTAQAGPDTPAKQQAGPAEGSGAVSTAFAPLPLADQLTWTPQRRVVQAYVIAPDLHHLLPPLSGITGGTAGGSEPLLFVPMAALGGDSRMAGLRPLPAVAALPPPVQASPDPAAAAAAAGPSGAAAVAAERDAAAVPAEARPMQHEAVGAPTEAAERAEAELLCDTSEGPAGPGAPASRQQAGEAGAPLAGQAVHGVAAGLEAAAPREQQGAARTPVPGGAAGAGAPAGQGLAAGGGSLLAEQAEQEAAAVPMRLDERMAGSDESANGGPAAEEGEEEQATVGGLGAERAAWPGEEGQQSHVEDEQEEEVEGVVLVTCRAAMRGRFPLNGTYFQVNEVFADQSTADRPLKVPGSLLARSACCAVHFGQSIHYMSRGMTQQEVANMFSHGYVCFRAFDPATGAPMPLPDFLAPSVHKPTPSTWKPKAAARAAERAAKAAARQLLSAASKPWAPAALPPGAVRLVPPLLDGGGFAPPPAVTTHDAVWPPPQPLDLSQLGLGDLLLTPQKRKGVWADGELGPFTPPAPRKRPKAASGGGEMAGRPSEDAADRKSGKGRTRVHLFPVVRTGQRCGHCDTCLNPHWKKACTTRRREMEEAQAA